LACAKGGLMDPSPASGAGDGGVPAGSTLSIVSGETGAPLAGASVTLDGQSVAVLGDRFTLPAGAASNGILEVRAAGYLDRVTRLRSRDPIALWPRQSATGLDESFTSAIVYSDSSGDTLAGGGLYRPGSSVRMVYVAPSSELQGDAQTMNALREGAARLSSATGGQLRWAVETSAPAGAVRFDVRFDPADSGCTERVLGYANRMIRGFEIVGGSLVFCRWQGSRLHIVMHELGHTLGLRHSPDSRELMFATANSAEEASPRESLAMRLMLLRRPGNRFPDNDADATGQTALRQDTVVCPR